MQLTLPEEDGWYWCRIVERDEWRIAHIDTAETRIAMWGEDGIDAGTHLLEAGNLERLYGRLHWYGPLVCPRDGETVVASQEDHRHARENGLAIVISHIDARHCPDRIVGRSLTSVSALPLADARRRISSDEQQIFRPCGSGNQAEA